MPENFEPKPALRNASVVGLQSAAVGTVVSTLQNALGSHSAGAVGVITRTGSTITFFTAMGAAFAFTEATVANQRQKDDAWNGAAGACAAGFLAGIRARSIPAALGGCAFLGATMGIFDHAGEVTGTRGVLLSDEQRSKFFKKPLDLPGSDSS